MNMDGMLRANAAITRMLVGKGVRVTQRGTTAFVAADPVTLEPTVVNLPCLPDDAPALLVEATQGYIDHEAGHIIFTDWTVCVAADREGIATEHNLVEDCFVERSMAEAFPGSTANLDRLHELFVTEITPTLLREAGGDEGRALGVLAVPAVRALAGQPRFQSYMDGGGHWDRPAMKAFMDAFGAVGRARLPTLRSSAECLELARHLEVALRAGEEAASARAAAEAGRPGDRRATGAERAASGAARGRADEGDGTQDGQPATSAGRHGKAMRPDAGSGEDVWSPGLGSPGSTARAAGSVAAAPSADPFSSSAAEALSDRAEASVARAPYSVFTRDLDVMVPLDVSGRYEDVWLADLDAAVSQAVGGLQGRLERALAAKSVARASVGRRSGRLHSASLHKVALGDDRAFRRKEEALRTDAAVSLLVDNSGSMKGPKMKLAMMAGYALARTADRARVPCECLGFTTAVEAEARASDDAGPIRPHPSDAARYSRTIPLFVPIYKAFDERLGPSARQRFAAGASGQWFCCGNVDGESVAIAARRLLARREARKVLIVLSDGRPAGGHHEELCAHLHSTVEAVTNAGIELLGVGVEDDAVREFYPRSSVLEDIADLPGLVMSELGRVLEVGRPPGRRPATARSGVRRR